MPVGDWLAAMTPVIVGILAGSGRRWLVRRRRVDVHAGYRDQVVGSSCKRWSLLLLFQSNHRRRGAHGVAPLESLVSRGGRRKRKQARHLQPWPRGEGNKYIAGERACRSGGAEKSSPDMGMVALLWWVAGRGGGQVEWSKVLLGPSALGKGARDHSLRAFCACGGARETGSGAGSAATYIVQHVAR
jgi:hypothetical protein